MDTRANMLEIECTVKGNLIEGCSRNRGPLEDIPEINQNQSESIPSLSLSAEDMDAIRFLSCKISL